MALTCDAQNRIKLMDIIDAINLNETDQAALYSWVGNINTETEANTTINIAQQLEIDGLTGAGSSNIPADILALTTLVSSFEADILANTSNVDTLTTAVTAAETLINSVSGDITANAGRLDQLDIDLAGKIDILYALTVPSLTNKVITEIDFSNELNTYSSAPIDPLTNPLLTRSELDAFIARKNYSIIENRQATGINGGASTAGSWEATPVNNVLEDNIGVILLAQNKFILLAGDYQIEGFVVATGAYHQVRLHDVINNVTIADGSSGDGTSYINSSFTLAADVEVQIQSQVDTSVALEGYGKANPFGDGVFAQIKITKLGV